MLKNVLVLHSGLEISFAKLMRHKKVAKCDFLKGTQNDLTRTRAPFAPDYLGYNKKYFYLPVKALQKGLFLLGSLLISESSTSCKQKYFHVAFLTTT
jgi:hypothetical protein